MRKELIIRAWKDPAFRTRLSTEERAALPESPAGVPLTEIKEAELSDVTGGMQALTRHAEACGVGEPTNGRCNQF